MTVQSLAQRAYHGRAAPMRSPRRTEFDVIARVTQQLRQASAQGAPFARMAEAVHENRRVWAALSSDLASPDNALPEPLRAELLSLSIFVARHGAAVLRGEAGADALIEVNTAILRGLAGPGPAA